MNLKSMRFVEFGLIESYQLSAVSLQLSEVRFILFVILNK